MSKAQLAALLFTLGLGGMAHAATFTGTVFEDANYGGGAGRSLAAAGGSVLPNVTVELYNFGTGAWVATGITNASGVYSLSSGNTTAQMRVRVVNGTVHSARGGGAACATCVPVQTFRTENTVAGTVVVVTDHVGGENPALSDSVVNPGTANYSTLTVAGARPQSITTATPALTTSIVSGLDFGFNFDTVVNTRDAASCTAANSSFPCQGSLRQFVINANALSGEGALSQSGSGQIDGSTSFLPSGFESSIFMIPDGSANAGQNTGYASQLSGGVAVIALSAALTTVSGASTRLDASTQTVNVGNDNPGTLGTGGTVGVDGVTLPTFPRPEVQLTAGETVVTLGGNSSAILGFALRQGYILISGSGCLARNNLVGMTATGSSTDNSAAAYGITFQGSNATIRNNFVTVNNSGIRTDSGGTGALITLNEVARPGFGHNNTFDGILLVGTVSSIQVTANLARDQQGGGIEVGFGGGAAATSIQVSNNTVRGNGFTSAGGTTASTEPIGMAAYDYSGSGVVFSRNLVRDNAGPGIMIMNANGTQVSQNSFSSNGGLSIDLDPRSIDPNGLGAPQGVTLNDNGDADAGPNGLRNFPVIANAVLIGGELSFSGFARPGSSMELYLAQADPSGFGEGLTYLGLFTEGSAADLDATTGTYGPAVINGLAQGTDTTNRFAFRITAPGGVVLGARLTATATIGGETSEFGGNVLVTAGPTLVVTKEVKSVSDPVNGATNPKSIPGSVELYTVHVVNQGAGGVDNNSVVITDPVPANTKLFVGNIGAPGSGPVALVDGTPSSALTWTFTALNSTTDDIDFSNDGGTTWTYVPVADAQTCDGLVNAIRLRPKGLMPGQGTGSPSFDLQFRVVVR
jgi:parallel beta-helix repeat protein